MHRIRSAIAAALAVAVAVMHPAAAQPAAPQDSAVTLSPVELFAFADAARARGDYAAAEAAYRALAENPDIELRTEARFRLATMFIDDLGRDTDAAVLLRRILDEKPDAAPVRLELARVLGRLGDEAGVRRELRQAQAGDLPPQVAQFVDSYVRALSARRPFGGSATIGLAPDSNINRATRSDTIDTVFAPFTLSEDARQQSGLGLTLGGNVFARTGLTEGVGLLARATGDGRFYRQGAFNDTTLSLLAGPEVALGRDRLNIAAGYVWRWFGGDPYSETATVSGSFIHPAGRQAQLAASLSAGRIDNRLNDGQDGEVYGAGLSYDRALGSRGGIGIGLSGARQDARNSGYAAWQGGVALRGFREMGRMTVRAEIEYRKLEADARLFLFPERRSDDRYSADVAATFRQLTFFGFAPAIQIGWERNRSTVDIYDYRRISGQVAIERAF